MLHSTTALRSRPTLRQRGVAAVELAVLIPLFITLLVTPLYLGRYFYHYSIAQKAVQNAVTYLSRAPSSELSNPARAPIVAAVATQMITAMLSEVAASDYPPSVMVHCGDLACNGLSKPESVTVGVEILVEDLFFPTYLSIPVQVTITLPHMGR